MSKQVKLLVVSNTPRTVTIGGVSVSSNVLTKFTAGKVYDADLYSTGELLPMGLPAFADTLVLVDDDGVLSDVIYQGPELELVEE